MSETGSQTEDLCLSVVSIGYPKSNKDADRLEDYNIVVRRVLVCPSHPAAQTRNNHTETILFKSLFGPLALASYFLTLTS